MTACESESDRLRDAWKISRKAFLEINKSGRSKEDVLFASKVELIYWSRYRQSQGYPCFNPEYR